MISKFCEKVVESYEMYGLWKTVLGTIIALALVFGSLCLEGWLLMVVLDWFEAAIGFWWCVAIIVGFRVIITGIENWAKG